AHNDSERDSITAEREFGEGAAGGEAPNVCWRWRRKRRSFVLHGEPEVAVGACGEVLRLTLDGGKRQLGERALRPEPPDLIGLVLGEPQIAIGANRDVARCAAARGERELGDADTTPWRGGRVRSGTVAHGRAERQEHPGEQGNDEQGGDSG